MYACVRHAAHAIAPSHSHCTPCPDTASLSSCWRSFHRQSLCIESAQTVEVHQSCRYVSTIIYTPCVVRVGRPASRGRRSVEVHKSVLPSRSRRVIGPIRQVDHWSPRRPLLPVDWPRSSLMTVGSSLHRPVGDGPIVTFAPTGFSRHAFCCKGQSPAAAASAARYKTQLC